MKYSEVKHDDKFHAALSHGWRRLEPFARPLGIIVGVLLVALVVWMLVESGRGGDEALTRRFEIRARLREANVDDPDERTRLRLAELRSFTRDYQGSPAAAVALLEMAQGHFDLATRLKPDDPKAAREHLEKAAHAAEQFIADYADHPLLPYAHYEAGKAWLDLGDHEAAAPHFEAASGSPIAFLAALAQFHAGLCYEKAGRIDDARRAYTRVRDDKAAAWCADQAEFHLNRLDQQPHSGS